MGTKRVTILTFIVISLSAKAAAHCQNGATSRNLIASALQDILSSSNTEVALQMLKMAAGPIRKTAVPETAKPVRTILPKASENWPLQTFVTNEIPRPVPAKEIPMQYIMANKDMGILRSDEIVMPRTVANNGVMAFKDPNEIGMPRVVANKDMRAFTSPYEIGMPYTMANKDIFMCPGETVMPRVMQTVTPDVYERQIYGKPVMEQNRNFYENRLVNYSPVLGDEVLCPCSQSSLVNPFLPMASPVSAFSPTTSNKLPPPTQGRSQYLRKIPIPPPTL